MKKHKPNSDLLNELPYEVFALITNYFENSSEVFSLMLTCKWMYDILYCVSSNYNGCKNVNFRFKS